MRTSSFFKLNNEILFDFERIVQVSCQDSLILSLIVGLTWSTGPILHALRPSSNASPLPSYIWPLQPINWWDQMRNNLFWNQTWTTLMSRPVSVASCSLTCRAGFGEVLYAFFNTCNINAGIHVGILSAFFIWTSQEKTIRKTTQLTAPPSAGLWSWSEVACSRHPLHNQQLGRDFNAGMENVSFFCFRNYCFPQPSCLLSVFNLRYAQFYASLVFFFLSIF